MQDKKVSYTFRANNTIAFYKLIALCILEFFLLLVIFLWLIVLEWMGGEGSSGFTLIMTVVLPIATFYLFRKRATDEITVFLSASDIEIQWPKKSIVILFADVKSYSADSLEGDESADVESVRIRLKNGKKIRLYASSNMCDIKPLGVFRAAFHELAQSLNLEQKYFSW